MPDTKPASGKLLLDWRTAYFAIVALVSMLAMGFSLISFLQDIILLIFPGLVEADIANEAERVARFGGEDESRPPWSRNFTPRYTDMVREGITILIMGVIFYLHGARFFRERK